MNFLNFINKGGIVTMDEVTKKFEELKSLMGKTDAISEARRDEIALWIKANGDKPAVKEAYNLFMNNGLQQVEASVEVIRNQIAAHYDLLPIAYIAKQYFGKSRAWLYQRINGNKVNGKVYSLNSEQKAIFNGAVKEIAHQIASVQLV